MYILCVYSSVGSLSLYEKAVNGGYFNHHTTAKFSSGDNPLRQQITFRECRAETNRMSL